MSFRSVVGCVALSVFAPLGVAQGNNIELPPLKPAKSAQATRPLSEVARFQHDVEHLRGSSSVIERGLTKLQENFPDVRALVVTRLRSAGPRELQRLMIVARRFPSPQIADEILFQLLARPVGSAARDMVATLVKLKGADAKPALQQCILGRVSGTRRQATDAYVPLANGQDLGFALSLVDEQKLDVRLSGVRLLGAVPEAKARERLVGLLAQKPTVAGASCTALIGVGPDAVPVLRKLLTDPPIDRSFAYAAFILVAGSAGAKEVPEQALVGLRRQLVSLDALTRSLAAVGLAGMCYEGRAKDDLDAPVVDALLNIVVPAEFIPNLNVLSGPANLQLQRLTGRSGQEAAGWREWWTLARPSFSGVRLRLAVDESNVGSAVIELEGAGGQIRIMGEALAAMKPRADADEYLLGSASMLKLVGELEAAGFMQSSTVEVSVPLDFQRTLELVVGGARAQARASSKSSVGFLQLVDIIDREAQAEVWQQLRDPVADPDRGAFWRTERKWRQEHADPIARGKRTVGQGLSAWPALTGQKRSLFLAWLLARPDRKELIDEADGLKMLGLVHGAEEFSDQDLLLLELAVSAPGGKVWRDAIDLAASVETAGGSAVERLFAILGPDRVLLALEDKRARVRRAALDEVVRLNDLRARDTVVALLEDPDVSVRRVAVFAAGQLEIAEARLPLIDLIVNSEDQPEIRRESLVALGKVGGSGVFGVLQQALAAPLEQDRQAAIRGLGELDDPRAAKQLATIFVVSLGSSTGELARFYLQRMGSKLAIPALRAQLGTQNRNVRNQVVLLLGGYQDPKAVPDLVDLLRQQYRPLVTASMVAATTGLDVRAPADLISALEVWYREHSSEPQWLWLIQGLDRAGIPHILTVEQFTPDADLMPVPELCRIMVDSRLGRMRVLASAVLRTVTGEDYGEIQPATPREQLEAIAMRYRRLYESARAARNR